MKWVREAFAAIRAALVALEIPGVAVVALALLLIAAIFVFALAGLNNPRIRGGTDQRQLSIQNSQEFAALARVVALSGSETGLKSVLDGDSQLLDGVINDIQKALTIRDQLPNSENIVPLLQHLSVALTNWKDKNLNVSQNKTAYNEIKELIKKIGQYSPYVSDGKTILASGKVTISHANDKEGFVSGVIRRNTGHGARSFSKEVDGEAITLDSRIPFIVDFLVHKGFSLNISSIVGNHSKNVKGKDSESHHWRGHGFDINVINGKDVDGSAGGKDEACKLMQIIVESLDELSAFGAKPWDVIGPTQCKQWAIDDKRRSPIFDSSGGHENHVHIGFSKAR